MKILLKNKKVIHDYIIMDAYEAGLRLTGDEVKSLRQGQGKIADAYVHQKEQGLVLSGLHIPPYASSANPKIHDSNRPRTLLMHKREIRKLCGTVSRQGLTLIPTKIYVNSKGYIKAEVALTKGKTKADKRETLKQRSWQRHQQQLLKKSYLS